ncbi:hypothetical protein [Candidatus Azobacteroides pseudotrichonymphae]|jgi:predicted transcriptional regulator|uniref:Uncharacterized protein n=1 Tax=Azobacteroides pseudotrichonymphae genomovar. CFP2 TaxID=511995 RepID=B6YSE1_AZOPC|nr:hypothetical protein [Candidatus Azobacteroides pseudotrichonymphae]BAG84113.1 hypothetical protein CFPG_P4-2 [Candidatus Azobacteroides pseudotrichonymphae genomovar. CFP2]
MLTCLVRQVSILPRDGGLISAITAACKAVRKALSCKQEDFMKSVDELKQEYAVKLAALKKEKSEALKRAMERERKKLSLESKKNRKLDAHLKIILGGYILADIKQRKDKVLLGKIAETLKNDDDKKLILSVLSSEGK